MDLFFHSNCIPFTIALGFLVFLSLYQMGAMMLGLSVPGVLDLPDLPDLPDSGWVTWLDWLNLGRIPVVVSLILLSWVFGATGLILQSLLDNLFGFMLSKWIAVPAVGVLSVTLLHWIIPPVSRILPKDETSAIDEDYVGRTAVITIGVARADRPAEARTRDRFGRDRYLRIIPDLPDETLASGEEVLIVAKKGIVYTAIRKDA